MARCQVRVACRPDFPNRANPCNQSAESRPASGLPARTAWQHQVRVRGARETPAGVARTGLR